MFIDATICRASVPQQPPRTDRCGSRVSRPWPDDFQRLRGQRSGPGVGSRAVIQHRASGGPATFPTVAGPNLGAVRVLGKSNLRVPKAIAIILHITTIRVLLANRRRAWDEHTSVATSAMTASG